MTTDTVLPAGFEDLARFLPDWAHATEQDRNAFRVSRTLAELDAFYGAMMPRLTAIAEHLDAVPLAAMPRDCANLLELALMTMEVAPAVEYYRAADVPDAFEYEKYRIHPVPSRYTVLGASAEGRSRD